MGFRATPRVLALTALLLVLTFLVYSNLYTIADGLGCSLSATPDDGLRRQYELQHPPPSKQLQRTCSLCESSPEWCRSFGERNMELVNAYEGASDSDRDRVPAAR